MKTTQIVEAALFSAGRPLSVDEICAETGLAAPAVRQAIDDLRKAYAERDTVLEVGKAGTKWAMQVRSQASEPAAKFAPMEIAPKLLKTLALIAYHQPLKQSELVEMIGTKVYDHVPDLVERGLIRARQDGITKILTTTPSFPEYFGLDAGDPDQVRAVMAKLVGLPPPEKRKNEKGLDAFAEAAAEVAAEAAEPVDGGADAPAEEAPDEGADDAETTAGDGATGGQQAADAVEEPQEA